MKKEVFFPQWLYSLTGQKNYCFDGEKSRFHNGFTLTYKGVSTVFERSKKSFPTVKVEVFAQWFYSEKKGF